MLAPLQRRDTVSQGSKHVLGEERKMEIFVGISFHKEAKIQVLNFCRFTFCSYLLIARTKFSDFSDQSHYR